MCIYSTCATCAVSWCSTWHCLVVSFLLSASHGLHNGTHSRVCTESSPWPTWDPPLVAIFLQKCGFSEEASFFVRASKVFIDVTSQEAALAGEEGISAQVTSRILCTDLTDKTFLELYKVTIQKNSMFQTGNITSVFSICKNTFVAEMQESLQNSGDVLLFIFSQ